MHDWVEVKDGSVVYPFPFKFCTKCDREEDLEGILLREGIEECHA